MIKYRIIEEKESIFRIDKRKTFLGINFPWREHYNWYFFANDDGGWPEHIRFLSEEAGEKYLKNKGIQHIGSFITNYYPKGTI